jgi:hypothetical protein
MDVRDMLEGVIRTIIAHSEDGCYDESDAVHARDAMRAAFLKAIGIREDKPHAIGTVNDPVEQKVTFFAVDAAFDGLIVYSVEFYIAKRRCIKKVEVFARA